MLVVSGSDLVGKSTFCAKVLKILQEDYKLPHMLQHLSRIPPSFDRYSDYVGLMNMRTVWDRFALDELAYRNCDDYPSNMTPLKWDLTEAQFRLHCGYQVVLVEEDIVINNRFALKGDPMYSLEHILKVNEQFHKMIDSNDLFRMRDCDYQLRIDNFGEATDKDLIPSVVNGYIARLKEFGDITRDLRLICNMDLPR